MSTIVSTVLVSAPPAFLSGWILSKAVFRHLSVTRPRTAVPADPAPARPQAGVPTDSRKLQQLQKKLAQIAAQEQSLQSEVLLLKEAAAEKEQTVVELRRKLQTQVQVPEQKLVADSADRQRYRQMMEGKQTALEQHVGELRSDLAALEQRTACTRKRASAWRARFGRLAKQFRQQRTILRELREELRQRDLQQQVEAHEQPSAQTAAQLQSQPATVSGNEIAPQADQISTHIGSEDLQALRGVGPVMHKKLNAQGVYRLQQLAGMQAEELVRLGKAVGLSSKQATRHDWSAQARSLLGMSPAGQAAAVPAETESLKA